ncbi:MAG: haloacid dehalogenase-like hydrolase, partial [bacterium]|nr:haloacid dehalogenase-like hydrolase [bacterium]
VKPLLYREGLEKIKEHKKAGDRVVLLTSAPYIVINYLADFVQADQVYASGPVVVKGIVEPTLREPVCYREGKIVFAEQAASESGLTLKDCFYYADHTDDLPLLQKVGSPCVVNPTFFLKQTAKEHGWPILHWASLLKDHSHAR